MYPTHTAQELAAIAAFTPLQGAGKYVIVQYGEVDDDLPPGAHPYGITRIYQSDTIDPVDGESVKSNCPDWYLSETGIDAHLDFGAPWVYVPGVGSCDFYVGLASRWQEIKGVLPTAQVIFGGGKSHYQ